MLLIFLLNVTVYFYCRKSYISLTMPIKFTLKYNEFFPVQFFVKATLKQIKPNFFVVETNQI